MVLKMAVDGNSCSSATAEQVFARAEAAAAPAVFRGLNQAWPALTKWTWQQQQQQQQQKTPMSVTPSGSASAGFASKSAAAAGGLHYLRAVAGHATVQVSGTIPHESMCCPATSVDFNHGNPIVAFMT
jgi:hypothetical protein